MSRLIDADAYKERHADILDCEIDHPRFQDTIRELIDEEPTVDRWIPCSERLPEEHEWIGTKRFGTTISDKVHITFDVDGDRFVKTLSLQNGELSNHEKHIMDAFYKGWKMIAWMPLPEKYKGE